MELARIVEADYVMVPLAEDDLDRATAGNVKNEEQMAQMLKQLETQMREAAKKFEFEKAGHPPRPHPQPQTTRPRGPLLPRTATLTAESQPDVDAAKA